MKTKFTPGPWKFVATPTRKETKFAVTTSNQAPIQAVICMVDSISLAHKEEPERDEYNARLIAAAPDLLVALHGMLHGLRIPTSAADQAAEREEACSLARAAIAKATGIPGGLIS